MSPRASSSAPPRPSSCPGSSHVGLSASTKVAAYRILREALVNARKHANARHITLTLRETDHRVIITLVDDGAGATALDAGSGHLGLATMRGRATNEGGHLEITSEPGDRHHRHPHPAPTPPPGRRATGDRRMTTTRRGSAQRPARWGNRRQPDRAVGSLTMHRDTSSGAQCSVLVCDDRPEVRAAIRSGITGDPRFTVTAEARDAASCLHLVGQTRPDVLILDVNMPGGGPDIARAVKQLSPTVQIMVYSSSTNRRSRPDMLAAGADDYVTKTGRLQPLLDGLHRAADRLTAR